MKQFPLTLYMHTEAGSDEVEELRSSFALHCLTSSPHLQLLSKKGVDVLHPFTPFLPSSLNENIGCLNVNCFQL